MYSISAKVRSQLTFHSIRISTVMDGRLGDGVRDLLGATECLVAQLQHVDLLLQAGPLL